MSTTVEDVAEYAGTSVATVSHVINDTRYVSPDLREKVEQALDELDYKPNRIAKSLKTNETRTFGLLVSDITNPHFSHAVKGVESIATKMDYGTLVASSDESVEKQNFYIDLLLGEAVDGIILAPAVGTKPSVKKIVEHNVDLVFIDRKINGIAASSVLAENISGAYEATKYLIEHGHRKIGIILGLEGLTTTEERLEGYKSALRDHDIAFKDKYVVGGGSHTESAISATQTLLNLSDRPSAIFSTSNLMTIGVIKTITSEGLKCPQDMSVIAFDDFDWASAFEPALTTVAQKPFKMGSIAASLALEMIKKKGGDTREIRTPTELIVRDSVGEV